MVRIFVNIILCAITLTLIACQTQEKAPPKNAQEDKISMMSKKEIVEQKFIQELWNEKNFETASEIFLNDFHTQSMSFEPSNWIEMHGLGAESMIHHIKWWLGIIPDAKMLINSIAENGDTVLITWKLVGTMKGEILKQLPNNKLLEIPGCTEILFEGKKIKMNKTLLDKYGLMKQIGAL